MKDITDLRVIKTIENIKHGFEACIRQKTFSSISVRDITAAARINRSTFYKYYEDKYQLRELLVKSTLGDLANNVNLASFNLENKQTNESLNALKTNSNLCMIIKTGILFCGIKIWSYLSMKIWCGYLKEGPGNVFVKTGRERKQGRKRSFQKNKSY
ncbi:TetR/AcrR family transcriptional regulator [Paenibacillus sp. P46E]|uniref:TetR/AcrR family transcriptional regulator n=1 Tax=Paenibacillus sp. P46E TaxID=1349436 RepID=UPI0009390E5E|nr:TetR family transcriptional regulator [Paenibacillus sp. P46E]